jgi:predicted RNA-binding protein with PUA-like domain
VQVSLEPVRSIEFVSLSALKTNPKLEGMIVLRSGNRLSVMPVDKTHFLEIVGERA